MLVGEIEGPGSPAGDPESEFPEWIRSELPEPTAVAAWGSTLLVAWVAEAADRSTRVELARVGADGSMTANWTLAHDVEPRHLSLTLNAGGGLLTWQREEPAAAVVAQLLGPDGQPSGEPVTQVVPSLDDNYYTAVPSALVDGSYRVVHARLDGSPWYLVDPSTREIAVPQVPTLASLGSIKSIVPLAQGALISVSDRSGTLVRISNDAIVEEVELGESAPSVMPTADGFQIAYSIEGTVYLEDRAHDLSSIGGPTTLVEQSSEDYGCSVGRGGGLVFALALIGLRRRRRRGA